MMYWPRPHELEFRLSPEAVYHGLEIVHAEILSVDRCWRMSIPDEYIPHAKTYHLEEIDQTARDRLISEPAAVEIPEIQMLGNSRLSFRAGVYVFVLLREMADLGYMSSMPFALWPADAAKFGYYFRQKDAVPSIEIPALSLYGVGNEDQS